MVVKTFRGLLANGAEDRIRLQTIKGKVGYRIAKFEIMQSGMASDQISVVKITKTTYTQTSTIDFTDSDLLAAGVLRVGNLISETLTQVTIFDNEIFNQDIYINNKNIDALVATNYYIELEVIPLDDAGAEYTTLKDMRQV